MKCIAIVYHIENICDGSLVSMPACGYL
jgi:hypothetical protein